MNKISTVKEAKIQAALGLLKENKFVYSGYYNKGGLKKYFNVYIYSNAPFPLSYVKHPADMLSQRFGLDRKDSQSWVSNLYISNHMDNNIFIDDECHMHVHVTTVGDAVGDAVLFPIMPMDQKYSVLINFLKNE